ncbi:response regulator [Niallia sp. Sow4_A1]|uniref:response regulator n=1 Tax=Niallia sp. Sow4_A1 TaxID=3438793 RepID=UPI003F99CBFB
MFNLLVVEDEDMIRHKIINNTDWLSHGFQQVFEAENGSEAVEILAKSQIDILITDIKMPIMDGIQLTKHVKEFYPQVKVIIISGHADFDFARKSITLKVCEYMLKPFQSKNLLKLVLSVKKELVRDKGEQENVEEMRKQLRENRRSLREKLIQNLLTNCFVGNLENDLKYVEMDHLKNTPFFVAVINLEQFQECKSAKEEEEKYLYNLSIYKRLSHMMDTEWALTAKDDRIEKGYILNYKIDQIVLIIFQDILHVSRQLEKVISNEGKEKGFFLTIGIGNGYNQLLDLHLSYEEACSAAALSRIHGPGGVYFFYDVSMDHAHYSKQLQKIVDHKIYSDLKSGDFEEVKKDVAELLAELKNSGIPYEAVSTAINNILLMSCKTINELGYDVNEIFGEAGLSFYFKRDNNFTYKELENRLYSFYSTIHTFIESKRGNRTERLIVEMKHYMNENYADNISLTSLSREFNISPSYLSILFREITSEHFSDYLTNLRIQKGKELLKNTDLRIKEIASQIGYRDAYYFSSVFKKVTGVNPTQYREE